MAKKQKGPKIIRQNFYLFNMVIQPVEKQSPERYINVFRDIFNRGMSVKISKNSFLRMMSLNFYENGGPLYGTFVKYQELEDKGWYNSVTNSLQQVNVDEHLYPNGHEIGFYFYPDKHRLVVESYLRPTQVKHFFEKSIESIVEGTDMDVVFHVVKTKEAISKIAENKNLTKLEICIYYTNSDNTKGWERFMDEENKESNVSKIIFTATGRSHKPIDVAKNTMLKAALTLSRENGYVRAEEQTNSGKKKITSEDSPEVLKIRTTEGDSVLQKVRNCLFGGFE